jgi:hypothetical protein
MPHLALHAHSIEACALCDMPRAHSLKSASRLTTPPRWCIHTQIQIQIQRSTSTEEHLQDMLQLGKPFLRVVLHDVGYLSLERGLPVKRRPLQEPEVAVQVIHTVLDGCATQNPSVGRG